MAGVMAEAEDVVANGSTGGEEAQPSIWEIIDEVIGVDRNTLFKILGAALSVLLLISGLLIHKEVRNDRMDLAMLHGGFVLLVIGLFASVSFVLFEAGRLESENGDKESKESSSEKRTKSD
eukprot:TRINITY_DN3212_c1_g1_i1.p1 TRINITY_DN3212_c1_g1~~TRINITY_DN3212_c1_g1_i1.p1  ORF type:complete len:134 (+),score=35.09 TRINITY_DN3212_c1_g1_i1:42-404(+)